MSHLLEFDAGGGAPWKVFDHTNDVGGTLITGDPAPMQSGELVRVFAQSMAPLPTSLLFNQHINLEGLDVGSIQGPVSVTMKSDGSYDFNGQLNNSAYLPYNFSVLFVLKSKSGTAFTFAVSNSISAGLPLSNNNYQWDNNGNNGKIKDVWGDLQAGYTAYYKAAASVDISTLWNDLQTAIGVVSTVVAVTGSL